MEVLVVRRGKNFRTTGKTKRYETSQGQILAEGTYADLQVQDLYDKQILSLCQKANLNAWDRIQQLGKWIESYTGVKRGQGEPFINFLQRLTKAVQTGVTDPEARWVLIESLAFENDNIECKKILGLLKFISAPMDEWILQTMIVETFDYNTEA